MIKIYSKNCEHILRIVGRIPKKEHARVFLAKDLCRKARVSESSARKGLQVLVQGKILKAVPGPGGGYKFSQHPKNVSLVSIVYILDGETAFRRCIMGLHQCSDTQPCPMHGTWKHLRAELIKALAEKTLFDLMKEDKE